MDRRRASLAVVAALVAGLAGAATQGPPVYTYTGTAPSGTCTGTRVLIDALGTGTYYCNAGTWALITGGGGGAPTTSQYWTGAADAGLSAEHNLGALATGLVLNTAGTPSAYGGASCTLPQLMQNLSASGAPTCFQLRLDQLAQPTADIQWNFTGEKILWDFQSPVDSGFSIHGTEAFLGDLVHIHQHSGNPAAGTDLLHIEATDPDVVGLRLTMASSADQAATITGAVGVTGAVTASSFSGPLTGAVTGNASTATALAADPADCSAGQAPLGITASGAVTGCFTPAGTYTLPAASATLGGVKQAAACAAGNHVSSIGAGGELTCTADAGGAGGSPGGSSGTVQYNNASAFGGMSRVTTDGGDLVLTRQATHATTPAAGFVKPYIFGHHGTNSPGMRQDTDGQTEMEYHPFPHTLAQDDRWGCVTPAGMGIAAITATGVASAAGTTGTAATVAWAVTDERTRHAWVQYAVASAASVSAGVRANADTMWRGNSAGLGGWYWWATVNIVSAGATQKTFFGLKDATAVITATAEPNAQLNTVYFGSNSAGANLNICSNDGTSTATCVDLGANFPARTANTAYDLALWQAPNSGTVYYYVRRLVNGSEAQGTITTDLPLNTVALGWDLWINSGTTAAIPSMQIGGTCYVANP